MSSNLTGSEQEIEKALGVTPEKSHRGKYWEVTYKDESPALEPWTLEKKTDLTHNMGKNDVEVTAKPGTRAVNLKEKGFRTCDFNHFTLDDSSFNDCTFVDCRFVKSNFNHVKFSKCHFDTCHFLNVRFLNCQFLDCTFSNISASAEQVVFIESFVSAAAFVEALRTNLNALPQERTKEYQEYRLLSTKEKIARAIFISVRNEPELDQLFDANRCFELARQRKRVKDAYWTTQSEQLIKRSLLYRHTVGPLRIMELGIIQAAGFLTNWGLSPLRSLWFLLAALAVFTGVYHFAFAQEWCPAILRALDCTFVFGYTRYAGEAKAEAVNYMMFFNTFTGFCWYALLVPALSKRLFR